MWITTPSQRRLTTTTDKSTPFLAANSEEVMVTGQEIGSHARSNNNSATDIQRHHIQANNEGASIEMLHKPNLQ